MFTWQAQTGGRFLKGALHTHSTRSDGPLSLEDTAQRYRQMGYDFMAVTDHRKFWRGQGVQGITLLPGLEADGDISRRPQRCHHMVAIGLPHNQMQADEAFLSRELPDIQAAQDMLSALKNRGNLVALAHPKWSRVLDSDYLPLEGLWAVEVYNSGCHLENDTGYATEAWDKLLAQGKRIFAIATDDAHQLAHMGKAWVMVHAVANTPEAIVYALQNGHFYASCGPEITEFYVHDGVLHVSCSPCARIILHNHMISRDQMVFSHDDSGEPVTQAAFPLAGRTGYVRVTCVDDHYRMAWSQPIWLDE
nr:CehA/McbA family metallohydrolase [bacterium]